MNDKHPRYTIAQRDGVPRVLFLLSLGRPVATYTPTAQRDGIPRVLFCYRWGGLSPYYFSVPSLASWIIFSLAVM